MKISDPLNFKNKSEAEKTFIIKVIQRSLKDEQQAVLFWYLYKDVKLVTFSDKLGKFQNKYDKMHRNSRALKRDRALDVLKMALDALAIVNNCKV